MKLIPIPLYVFLLIYVIIFSSSSFAENYTNSKTKDKLSLDKCISMALVQSPNYKSAYYSVKAKKILTSMSALLIPDITFTTKYAYTESSPALAFPVPPGSLSNSLSINKVLYNFGQMEAQLVMARKDHRIAILKAKQVKNDLVRNVTIAFFYSITKPRKS